MQTIRFRHAHFTARLPVDYRYTPSHFWLLPAPAAAGEQLPDLQRALLQAAAGQAATGQGTLWRVGFTKFAPRMLGELVDMVLEVEPGQAITPGSRLGTVSPFRKNLTKEPKFFMELVFDRVQTTVQCRKLLLRHYFLVPEAAV